MVINPNHQGDISLLPGSIVSALTSSNQVFGDEGVASELLRQQQFRQQRAVPLVSEACQLVLGSNLAKVGLSSHRRCISHICFLYLSFQFRLLFIK